MPAQLVIVATLPEPGFSADTKIDFAREVVRLLKAKFPADATAVSVKVSDSNAVISHAIQATAFTVGTVAAVQTVT